MLSCIGGCVYVLLRMRHRTYPFKLFALLHSASRAQAAADIVGDSPCFYDDFTARHLASFSTVEVVPEQRKQLC
eukprot:7366432-Alexandrium_andersonii.AAC.1